MKFSDLFIFNRRVLIFIIIGLVLEEILVSSFIAGKFSHPEAQKLPVYDEATLTLWVKQVKKAAGYKIVVLGDSVVHGDDVAHDDTLPIYIAKELGELCPEKQIKVFNMGMAGASPAEVYFLLNALDGTGTNLIIYNINLGWFGREETLEHQALLHFNRLNDQQLRSLGIEPLESARSPAEDWLEDHLFSHWQFLQYRLLLNYWLFGQPLRQHVDELFKSPGSSWLLGAEEEEIEKSDPRAPWTEKDWEGKLDPAQGRVGDVYLSENNAQWVLYQMLTDLVKRENLPMIFFVTPRNYELLNRYDMVDQNAYGDNLALVIEQAEDNGIPVLNYDQALPYDLFVDTIHPLAEGNQILADILVNDLINKGYIKR